MLARRPGTRAANLGKSLALLVVSIGLWLASAEVVCRFLPVHSGFEVQTVDAANPIIRFRANRDYLYSHGAFLTNVNRGHVNNYGFTNDQDYDPADTRTLLRHSALARYVVFNIGSVSPLVSGLLEEMHQLRLWFTEPITKANAASPAFIGNTASDADPLRAELAQRATVWVLDHLPESVGLPVSHILLLMDGYRVFEPDQVEAARNSFFGIMREYLITEAHRRGYEVQDMQEWFARRHRLDGAVFDFPDDGHWSALGHEEAANA